MEASNSLEQSINDRADEATAQLKAIAANLEGLILHSGESSSMKLHDVARQIGHIANSADNVMQSDYGID